MKRILLLAMAGLCLGLFSTCKKDNQPSPLPPTDLPGDTVVHVTELRADTTNFLLLNSTSRQLAVTVKPDNASLKNITWSSSDEAIAKVDASGLVTSLSPGDVQITATSNDRSNVTVTYSVSVLKDYDVYVCGTGPFEGVQDAGIYWKNGVLNGLMQNPSRTGFYVRSMTMSGQDLYITGLGDNGALYWKNGAPVELEHTSNADYTIPGSIAVANGKVFVAGYRYEDPGHFQGAYWVDDGGTISKILLHDDQHETMVHDLIVSGTDMLVAGSTANTNFDRSAAYWRNDLPFQTNLATSGFNQATTLMEKGSDIYIAGYGSCGFTTCFDVAKLWKNSDSSPLVLTTDFTRHEDPTGITYSGNDIYVGGRAVTAQTRYIALYWKVTGDVVSVHPLSTGVRDAEVNAVAEKDGDIFLAGYEKNDDGKMRACYWRIHADEVIKVPLPPGIFNSESTATGIVVQ